MEIKDQTNTDLVNLRRTIYLTVMSSIDPEEAVHKLLRINLPAGQERRLFLSSPLPPPSHTPHACNWHRVLA